MSSSSNTNLTTTSYTDLTPGSIVEVTFEEHDDRTGGWVQCRQMGTLVSSDGTNAVVDFTFSGSNNNSKSHSGGKKTYTTSVAHIKKVSASGKECTPATANGVGAPDEDDGLDFAIARDDTTTTTSASPSGGDGFDVSDASKHEPAEGTIGNAELWLGGAFGPGLAALGAGVGDVVLGRDLVRTGVYFALLVLLPADVALWGFVVMCCLTGRSYDTATTEDAMRTYVRARAQIGPLLHRVSSHHLTVCGGLLLVLVCARFVGVPPSAVIAYGLGLVSVAGYLFASKN
eukprot:PhM_4_TR16185/c0_g2_i1/m.14097